MANIQRAGQPPSPLDWYNDLPIVTRGWFGTMLVLTVLCNFEILDVELVVFDFHAILYKLELWRAVTCFFYAGGFCLPVLLLFFTLIEYSKKYEDGGPFDTGARGGTADYVFSLLFAMTTTCASRLFVTRFSPSWSLVAFVVYVWSRRNLEAVVHMFFGLVPCSATQFPFMYLFISLFTGGFFSNLHGFAVGHLFYFLVDVVPKIHGKHVLQTPRFLIDYFGMGSNKALGFHARAPRASNQWGGSQSKAQSDTSKSGSFLGKALGKKNDGGHCWGGGGRTLGAARIHGKGLGGAGRSRLLYDQK